MKSVDPMRDDAGVRLRAARLRRGMSQTALASAARVSPAYISMIETGQRQLTRLRDVVALAHALQVSPLYLADGRDEASVSGPGALRTVPFPARCDPITLNRHRQLARHYAQLACTDARATGDWLRHLAREPAVNPWLLIDQLIALGSRPVGRERSARPRPGL